MTSFSSLLMTIVVASWFTLIHNKVSILQFSDLHGKTSIKVNLERLAYSPLMRQNGLLLCVKLPRWIFLSKCFRQLLIPCCFQLQLHIFTFDEPYNQLQSWGSGNELAPWYSPGVSIIAMCFVHGSEELLLIGTDLVAKIYSLLTQQFRCDLSYHHMPNLV